MNIKEFRIYIENMDEVRIFQGPLKSHVGCIRFKKLREQTIEVLTNGLADGKISENLEFKVLGSHLYDTIFDSTISRKLREAKQETSEDKSIDFLRLVLTFRPNAEKLAELPWEYLYIPDYYTDKGTFIATHADVVLSRSVPLKQKGFKPIEPPLRVLFIISQPQEEDDVKYKPLEKVFTELKNQHPDSIKIRTLINPDKKDLVTILRKNKYDPHVIHFLCHGENGSLALINENKYDPLWLSDETIGYCLEENPPRLAFLQVCEGAKSEDYRGLKGLALQLAYSRVPAVIAMQYEINVEIANMFAEKFYINLFNGDPVDKAVQSARRTLAEEQDSEHFSSRDFGCPVLFLQVPDALSMTKVIKKGENKNGRS